MQNKKINSLQVLRAFAFFTIFIQHSYPRLIPSCAGWGVTIFFMLSGFLMVVGYIDRTDTQKITLFHCIRFGVKKMMRIYPLHILGLLFGIALAVLRNIKEQVSISFDFLQVFSNILLIQSWYPSWDFGYYFNGIAWFLSSMMLIYMCFPVILLVIKKIHNIAFILLYSIAIYIAMCCWIIFCLHNLHNNASIYEWSTYISPHFRLGEFAIGCNFGYIFYLNKTDSTILKRGIFVTLLCIGVVVCQIYFRTLPHSSLTGKFFDNTGVLFIPTSAVLIYLLAKNGEWTTKGILGKCLVWIGNQSAYLYLIHIPVLCSLGIIFRALNIFNIWTWLFVPLFLSFLCSFIYDFCDKKVRMYLKSHTQVSENS